MVSNMRNPYGLQSGRFLVKGAKVTVKSGSKVSIDYTLTVDGQIVDSSEGRDPLSYVQGESQIIPGLEEELIGLKKGDKKSVIIAPEKGYGERNLEAIHTVPSNSFKNPELLKEGEVVVGQADDQQFQAIIVKIGKEDVTLDTNHPLAEKTLNFEIEMMDIEEQKLN
jgi:FKBP-type peptidyl-prolyl cis-trans isomerase SlyD